MTKKVEFSLEAKLQIAAENLETARAERAVVTEKVNKYYNVWEKLRTEQIEATDYSDMTPELFKELSEAAFDNTAAYNKMNAWICALHDGQEIRPGGHYNYSDEPWLSIQAVQIALVRNQDTTSLVDPLTRIVSLTCEATGLDETLIDILDRNLSQYTSYKIMANKDGSARVEASYSTLHEGSLAEVLAFCAKKVYYRREND